jgi:hypothetical protein
MNSELMLRGYFRKYFSVILNSTIIALMLFASSCKKENTSSVQYPIPSDLKLIGSGYVAGQRAEIYATQNLYVGYNKLYVALYDSSTGTRITQSSVTLNAISSAGISGPVENPAANAISGLFGAAAVFVSAGTWTLTVNIQNATNNRSGSIQILVSPVQTTPAKSYTVSTDSQTLFVSIVQPSQPQLGVNNFELVVNRQISATAYAPDSTYMVAINATMPAMTGMNSPNNVNPSYTGQGHYVGKVDFIMTGPWWIYVDLARNGTLSDTSHYFSLNL